MYSGLKTRSQALSGIGVLPSAALTLSTLMPTVVKPHSQLTMYSLPGSMLRQLRLHRRVEVLQVRQLGLVELAQQAAVDLQLGPVRRGHDDVVAGLAGHQLGVHDLVVVEVVVADLDAGLLLEVLDRVVGDVVGPVVDVEDLLLLLGRQAGSTRKRQAPSSTPRSTQRERFRP